MLVVHIIYAMASQVVEAPVLAQVVATGTWVIPTIRTGPALVGKLMSEKLEESFGYDFIFQETFHAVISMLFESGMLFGGTWHSLWMPGCLFKKRLAYLVVKLNLPL